jgi:hypothetical protein
MHKTPRQLPAFSTILADLDTRRPRDLARYLGVSERTVFNWCALDQAPRPAHLALFWVTRWGESIISTEAHNAAIYHAQHAAALARENAALRARLAPSLRPAPIAANAPTFSACAPFSQTGLFDCVPVSA